MLITPGMPNPHTYTPTDGATFTYSVGVNGDGNVALWQHTSDEWDYRFTYGPREVMVKEYVDIAVWNAACRVLVGGK